ncbi:MAG: putative Ig domain-containing protein [Pirellulaceae bacterium]|jgi:hypothetical protein
MNQRERFLVGIVLLLVFGVGAQFMISRIRKGFNDKNLRITDLQKQISDKENTITDGLFAREKFQKLTSRSLPTDPQQASLDYRTWLQEVVDESGLSEPTWSRTSEQTEKGVYRSQRFNLTGRGTIQQLVTLLYRFHEKDYLHRISNLKVNLVPNEPYQLAIGMTIDALSLDAADPKQKPPESISHRVGRTLAEYQQKIVGRNLFAPANHPPNVREMASTEVAKDDLLSYEPGASDPDGHELEYAWDGEVPQGMRLDKATGKVSWSPKELGEYQVAIAITDKGLPSQSSLQKLTIKVVEPPPPPPPEKEEPSFDIASQASISALLVGSDGKPQVWIRSKLEGKTLFLSVGDPIKLGSVIGKVVAVGANYAEFESDGRRWTVGLDESLADAYRRSQID